MQRVAIILGCVVSAHAANADAWAECSARLTGQAEISACLDDTEIAVAGAMETALLMAMRVAETVDRLNEQSQAAPALVASQTAWDAYRDAQCDAVATRSAAGEGIDLARKSCRIGLGRERIRTLIEYSD